MKKKIETNLEAGEPRENLLEGSNSKWSRHEETLRLAYLLYEQEGKQPGRELEHWFNAETMMESQYGHGNDHQEHDYSEKEGR